MLPKGIMTSSLSIMILQPAFDKFYKTHSYSYTTAVKNLLYRTLKHAKKLGYIFDISFMEDIEIQKRSKTLEEVERERAKFLSKKELAKLLKDIHNINPYVSLLCEFQALTGLRFGELVALQTHEYDKNKKCINVSATLALSKGTKALIRNTAKNVYSIRTVSLDDRATEIIEQFINMNSARKEWSTSFNDTNFIFVTNGGYPFDIHYVNKVLKKASPDKPISTHTFRHTH